LTPLTVVILFALVAVGSALCWVMWTTDEDPSREVHRKQQKALRDHHNLQARDRREREHTAWWRYLGIGD
jgi:hypothetical protein